MLCEAARVMVELVSSPEQRSINKNGKMDQQ
jgi:hypothetical protein